MLSLWITALILWITLVTNSKNGLYLWVSCGKMAFFTRLLVDNLLERGF